MSEEKKKFTPVSEKYTKEYFAEAGRRGGLTTKKRYGDEHYKKLGYSKKGKTKEYMEQKRKVEQEPKEE